MLDTASHRLSSFSTRSQLAIELLMSDYIARRFVKRCVSEPAEALCKRCVSAELLLSNTQGHIEGETQVQPQC